MADHEKLKSCELLVDATSVRLHRACLAFGHIKFTLSFKGRFRHDACAEIAVIPLLAVRQVAREVFVVLSFALFCSSRSYLRHLDALGFVSQAVNATRLSTRMGIAAYWLAAALCCSGARPRTRSHGGQIYQAWRTFHSARQLFVAD